MGDCIAVLNRGVLQQLGTPRTLYHEPVNLFVASFIGSPAMNMLEGRLAQTERGPAIMIGAQPIDLPPALLARMPALARHMDRLVVLGIRPEAVHCAPQEDDWRRCLVGTVAFTEDLGATILVHFEVDAPPPRLNLDNVGVTDGESEIALHAHRARVRTSIDGMSALRPGDRMAITLDLERAHLFDPITGAAFGA